MPSAQKKKTRKYDSASAKESIRKAAIEIFSEKGFKAATTRMIAKKAKVNISIIARYFGSKERLFEVLIKEQITSLTEVPFSHPEQSNLYDELMQYFLQHFTQIEQNIQLVRIITGMALVEKKYTQLTQRVILHENDQRLLARINRLKDMGALEKDADIAGLSSSISSFCFGVIVYRQIFFNRRVSDLLGEMKAFARIVMKAYGTTSPQGGSAASREKT